MELLEKIKGLYLCDQESPREIPNCTGLWRNTIQKWVRKLKA